MPNARQSSQGDAAGYVSLGPRIERKGASTLRTAIIAAIVATLVSAASATAAFVVTSKNIKNGTIQLVDISPNAKKALRGQRGPQGPRGIQEVTVVTTPPMLVPPGFPNASVEATCPDGEQPISGGFQATGVPTVTTSAPNLARHAWVVIGNSGPTGATLTAVAYCAPNVTIHPLGP
jgi:hypothetical protein